MEELGRPLLREDAESKQLGNDRGSDAGAYDTSGSGIRQLQAVLRKNMLIKKRNMRQSLCELMSPILLMGVLVIGWSLSLSDKTIVEATNYANDSSVLQETLDAFGRSLQPGLPPRDDCIPLDPLDLQLCIAEDDLPIIIDTLDYPGPFPVIGFEQYVGAHNTLTQGLLNGTDEADMAAALDWLDRLTDLRLRNVLYLGDIIFTPDTPEVHQLVDHLNSSLPSFDSCFGGILEKEEEAVDRALEVQSYLNQTWAVVSFSDLDIEGGLVDYKIRMNYSTLPSTKELAAFFNLGLDPTYTSYHYSGFLTLQNTVSNAVLEIAEGLSGGNETLSTSSNSQSNVNVNSNSNSNSKLRSLQDAVKSASSVPSGFQSSPATSDFVSVPMPVPDTDSNPFYQAVGPLVGLVMVMSLLYPVSRLIKAIVEEKETKSKETMRIMGLKEWVLVASWFLTYLALFAVVAALLTGMLGVTMLENTDLSLLFVFQFLFLMTQIAFSFLVSVFFNRAKLAGIVGPLILFSTVMPRFAFFSTDAAEAIWAKTVTSVLSPTAYAFGADLLMQYEGANRGMGWDTIWDDEYAFGTIMLMMVLDLGLYAVLAWYLSLVLPTEYGSHRAPYFLCTAGFWRQSCSKGSMGDWKDKELEEQMEELQGFDRDGGRNNEAVPREMLQQGASVSVLGLRKVFVSGRGHKRKEVVAVKRLQLSLYEGQITALLGQNGAGKTVAISMLTGLITPTKGDCIISGRSVRHDMQGIRRSLGICPQHDVLFDDLTVREHMDLYATLKGVPKAELRAHSDALVEEVGLWAKRDVLSSALSGGMKRKLSVALALCGGSKVVFLDEPTSGMDPYSRRATWELLRKHRHNRTIVFTTHFMDEADLLGDRIAIMAEGTLHCVGSPMFLKHRFGIGYNLTLLKESRMCDPQVLLGAVREHVNGAQMIGSAGGEVALRLPLGAVSKFAGLFQTLELRKQKLGIRAYGVSMTTMEEVFLQIALLLEDEKKHPAKDKAELEGGVEAEINVSEEGENKSESNKGQGAKGDYYNDNDMGEQQRPRHSPFILQVRELVRKRLICALRDLSGRLFEVVLPVIVVALVLLILKLNVNPAGPAIALDADLYYTSRSPVAGSAGQPGGVATVPCSPNLSTREPLAFERLSNREGFDMQSFASNTSATMSANLLDSFYEHESNRFGSYIIDDVISIELELFGNLTTITGTSNLTILHNSTYFHALPLMAAELAQARLHSLLGGPDEEAVLRVSNHPLPLTSRERVELQTFLTLFAALFVLIPFCYLPASFVIFVVKERSVKAKHLQLVSGVHPVAYWVSTFMWDTINYLVVISFTLLVFLAYGTDEFVGTPDATLGTFVLMLMYGLSAIPLSYALSFVFTNHTSAQVGTAGLHFVMGFVLVVTSFVLDNVGESTYDVNQYLKHFYRLAPAFSFGEGLVRLTTIPYLESFSNERLSPFEWIVLGRLLLYMFLEAIAYFSLTLAIEYRMLPSPRKVWQKAKHVLCCGRGFSSEGASQAERKREEDEEAEELAVEDEDVAKERARMHDANHQGREGGDDVLKLVDLYKTYPPTSAGGKPVHAVRKICLGVPRGECFGLLGVNGAGKTTLLKCITGDHDASQGDAIVNGLSVRTELNQVRLQLGYTPQFDPLLELMTARETLLMYGRLRGMGESGLAEEVDALLNRLGLENFKDKVCGSYSGGNKRKLSLGMALVGRPPLILLDEPSTGMDPVSRRFMWTVIAEEAKRCSVVLTTHSMEECEALCSRIGIMIDGRLACLGPAQHLKTRFGQGYRLEINAADEAFEDVKKFVGDTFDGAVLEEFHGGRVKYRLPQQDLSLATIFGAIEEVKARLRIKDYSLSQTTLEQIFLMMARLAEQEGRGAGAQVLAKLKASAAGGSSPSVPQGPVVSAHRTLN